MVEHWRTRTSQYEAPDKPNHRNDSQDDRNQPNKEEDTTFESEQGQIRTQNQARQNDAFLKE